MSEKMQQRINKFFIGLDLQFVLGNNLASDNPQKVFDYQQKVRITVKQKKFNRRTDRFYR